MKRFVYLSVPAIAIAAFLAAAPASAQSISKHDIGGVVTGPHGPEAGVWVIAETHDLPTRFAKMVVTDDRGRYVVPDLPKGKYEVWVRGYGLINSPEGQIRAREASQPDRRSGAERCGGGAVLSGDLLVRDAEDTDRRPVRRQERHSRKDHPGRLADRDQEPGVCRLSSARPARHAHHPGGAWYVQDRRRSLGPPYSIRAGGAAHDQSHCRQVQRRAAQIFRRLDRPHRQGRTAQRQA